MTRQLEQIVTVPSLHDGSSKSFQMSKPEQLLKIDPPEALTFKGPFNIPSTSYMKLTNPSVHRLAFKIKTTAPKKYCVRPNCGFLDSQESIEIALCFQPFSYSPQERTKHKFMVQSVIAPEDASNLEEVWKAAPVETMMDSRLRCVFQTSDEVSASASHSVTSANDTSEVKSMDVKVELRKSLEEMELRLGEEQAMLRTENERLRMEILEMRKRLGVQVEAINELDSASTLGSHHGERDVLLYIGLGLLICFIGIVFGKYVF